MVHYAITFVVDIACDDVFERSMRVERTKQIGNLLRILELRR
jgi:hypothetical protein